MTSRYVGNKVAAFVLQSMGCDTATLNTVQFSKHFPIATYRGRQYLT